MIFKLWHLTTLALTWSAANFLLWIELFLMKTKASYKDLLGGIPEIRGKKYHIFWMEPIKNIKIESILLIVFHLCPVQRVVRKYPHLVRCRHNSQYLLWRVQSDNLLYRHTSHSPASLSVPQLGSLNAPRLSVDVDVTGAANVNTKIKQWYVVLLVVKKINQM